MGDTILRVDDIQKFYGNKGNLTKAINDTIKINGNALLTA